MDTNYSQNILEPEDSETAYRAMRDSILQVFHLGTKIAKESNPDHELQVSWDLADTSLMNWISDTHCYLSRKGHKLQFLARPSKLDIISFTLNEGDKLLICSESLRQHLSDNEIDEILQKSDTPENGIQNLQNVVDPQKKLKINLVILEVINSKAPEEPLVVNSSQPVVEAKVEKKITPAPAVSKPKDKDKETNSLILWTSLGLIAGGIAFFLWYNSNSHRLNGDSVPIIDSVQLNKASNSDSAAIAKANAQLSEELGIDTNSSDASTPSSTTSVPDSKEKSSTSTESFQSSEKSTSESSSTKSSTRSKRVLTQDEAVLQQELLNQQKTKWTAIRDALQQEVDNGSKESIEKLKNSEMVLGRIDKKLKETAKYLP
ncbi:hypothetical protein [Flectobacillus roseus]|uniref:Uncharacterized protein n=1 Tax=Flectobacillus roseus TaxID=502259 RepID=A0ABT6Y823_9BACT|nr:hypothetical protein [Flectobacillus roseus]MDI9859705.1 hypothetical protein [Flectobacillus roseus]NBA74229.1 hypothetical protein [Emticicia sp. ODNR4P]